MWQGGSGQCGKGDRGNVPRRIRAISLAAILEGRVRDLTGIVQSAFISRPRRDGAASDDATQIIREAKQLIREATQPQTNRRSIPSCENG